MDQSQEHEVLLLPLQFEFRLQLVGKIPLPQLRGHLLAALVTDSVSCLDLAKDTPRHDLSHLSVAHVCVLFDTVVGLGQQGLKAEVLLALGDASAQTVLGSQPGKVEVAFLLTCDVVARKIC